MGQTRVLLHVPIGWRQLVPGTYLLGRSADCDIVIPGNRASRRHARLTVTESGIWVEDLGSSNGTHVNGVAVSGRQELHHQDFLGIGASALEVAMEPGTGIVPTEILRPRGTIPPPDVISHEATIASSGDDGPERAIQLWADGVLASARAGRLDDSRTRRSAMQFGIQRASSRPNARWVDFVVELASLGIPMETEYARALGGAIDRVGVDASLLESYLTQLTAMPPSPEQRELAGLAESWRAHVRQS